MRCTILGVLLAITATWGSQAATAIEPGTSLERLEIRRHELSGIGTLDGIPRRAPTNGVAGQDPKASETVAAHGPRWVRSIAQSSEGRLWLATAAGLLRLGSGAVPMLEGTAVIEAARVLEDDGHAMLRHAELTHVIADSGGYLWVGTEGAGAFRFDGTSLYPISRPNGSDGRWSVSALFQDPDRLLWLATHDALLQVAPRSSTSFRALPDIRVKTIGRGPAGHLWVAGGSSLFRQIRSAFHALSLPLAVEPAPIHGLAFDFYGRLWLARGNGLLRLEGDFENDGLPQAFDSVSELEGREVRCVLALGSEIWAGTAAGTLHRWSPDGSLETVVLPEVGDGSRARAPISDLFLDREGSLWVATLGEGVVQISDPEEPVPAPATRIDAVSVGGRKLPAASWTQGSVHRFESGVGRLEIELGTASFRRPDGIRFRYRLLGGGGGPAEGGDWIPVSLGEAILLELRPGSFRFEAQAGLRASTTPASGERGGDWSWGPSASLAWDVEAPIWQHKAFRISALLLALGLALLAFLRRRAYLAWQHQLAADLEENLEWEARVENEAADTPRPGEPS
ncbi:MAG: hypothetical protein MI919_13140 [Holophagales bacterium]|nr:hypothetical protein [Holophagales bacterium]